MADITENLILRKTVNRILKLEHKSELVFLNTHSILFDGVDEHINIDAVLTALASTTVGAWSFWIKPVDATPAVLQVPLSFGDTNANTRIQIDIGTGGRIRVFVVDAGTIKSQSVTDLGNHFSDNTWGHLLIVHDGTNLTIYINGVAPAQTNSGTDETFWFNSLALLDNGRIGDLSASNNESNHFNGNIDEVLFINRALIAGEVLDIYNSGCPKDETNIANGVSYFRIDGDIINTAKDSIGANDGTYVNMEQSDVENDTVC